MNERGAEVAGTHQRLAAVRAGALPMSALTAEERTLLNAELDAAITSRAESLAFGDLLLSHGQAIVVLDEQGEVVETRPDGTTSRVSASDDDPLTGSEVARDQPAVNPLDAGGRLRPGYYGNQPNLFEVHCRELSGAARFAAQQGWWLHCWHWVPAEHDEPVVVIVGDPHPPWPR